MALGCLERPADGRVATAWQVLKVELVATTEAPSVRPVVVEHDGQSATILHLDQPLGSCLLQRGLHTETSGRRSLHTIIRMFQQVSHALVSLGECPRLLACLEAGLGGRLHTEALEVLSELGVRHQHVLHRLLPTHVDAEVLDQHPLAAAHFVQVLEQQLPVQLDHGFGVHPQRLINHQQLAGWEADFHLVPQGVGQVHIVLAVLAVLSEVSLSEVSLALALRGHHLVALLAQPVVGHQLGE